jgi:hypothetical protein
VKMSTRNIPGGKGGRCVRLTTSPPSRAECHEIWEPKPPGTLWAHRGLLRKSFTFFKLVLFFYFPTSNTPKRVPKGTRSKGNYAVFKSTTRIYGKTLNILRINNQQDASSILNFILSRNSTCFGQLLCPSSGVISCTRGSWYVSCRLCGRCLGESGWN